MKKKKTVHPKPEPVVVVASHTCDFCGQEIDCRRGWDSTRVTIEALVGDMYPECDARTAEEFDCCAGCWTAKVVPALVAIGGRLYKRNADEAREMPWVDSP